jgi:hypothetical protein
MKASWFRWLPSRRSLPRGTLSFGNAMCHPRMSGNSSGSARSGAILGTISWRNPASRFQQGNNPFRVYIYIYTRPRAPHFVSKSSNRACYAYGVRRERVARITIAFAAMELISVEITGTLKKEQSRVPCCDYRNKCTWHDGRWMSKQIGLFRANPRSDKTEIGIFTKASGKL